MKRSLRDGAGALGFGVAACAVCCAPLLLGTVAAAGAAVGAASAAWMLGGSLVLVTAVGFATLLATRRIRRRPTTCAPTETRPVAVALAARRDDQPATTP